MELFLSPAFEEEVTVRDELGIVKLQPKTRDSIPRFISWPVTDRESFKRVADEHLGAIPPHGFPRTGMGRSACSTTTTVWWRWGDPV